MAAGTQHALAILIGICREGRRELAGVASGIRRPHLRLLLLDAFDQRTQMLEDLHRFAPDCGDAEAVSAGWVLRTGGTTTISESELLLRCVAGEESTLRAVESIVRDTGNRRLQAVLSLHASYLRTLLARFRARQKCITINSR